MNLSEIRLYLSQAGLLTFDGTRGADPEILSVGCNSREAGAGQLFFCKGVRFKPEYLADALGRGACAYVAQSPLSEEVPYLLVSDIRKAMWWSQS
jgi:UDP-N-acetylmuramyl tripeptide synthase